MSPENREQLQKLLDDVWGTLVSDIGRSRGISAESLQATVDAEGVIRPAAALKARLVDRVAYRDELVDRLKKETGVTSPTDSFKQVQLGAYAKSALGRPPASFVPGEVAIVYAEGDIVDGEGDQAEIGGARFAREIRKLREDASVKAIVLRVNSPGGSASAAETIQRELRLARKVKPVIVSMGSYAASGGYWISAFGDRIFAEPSTITGSIGVFGIQFDVQKLANDHGVTFDAREDRQVRGRPDDRPPEDPGGDGRLPEAGGLDLRPVRREGVRGAQAAARPASRRSPRAGCGRAPTPSGSGWSTRSAASTRAIKFAGKQAKLGEHFRVSEYPRPRNLAEAIAELLGKYAPESLHLHATGLVGEIAGRLESELSWLRALNDPRGVYARLPVDLVIH